MVVATFSIGGYTLQNVQKTKGRNGEGYEADLYYGKTKIAFLEDRADGGMIRVDFFTKDEKYKVQVLQDMVNLITLLGDIAEKGGLWDTFIRTPYSAVEGFAELLLELEELVKIAKKGSKKVEGDNYYVVGSMGSSWFSEDTSVLGATLFFIPTTTTNYNEAYQQMQDYANKHKAKRGKVRQCAILQGNMGWHLTLQDYAELNKP